MTNHTFKIKSGQVYLTDPCYDADITTPAKNGEWNVIVEYMRDYEGYYTRVRQLTILHKDYCFTKSAEFKPLGKFPVDSGQFGIFDTEIYEDGGNYETPGFYRDCCDITLQEAMCGVVNTYGFVSSTGFGDGAYSGDGYFEDGKLVKFMITFIGDENEDYDEDDDFWNDSGVDGRAWENEEKNED